MLRDPSAANSWKAPGTTLNQQVDHDGRPQRRGYEGITVISSLPGFHVMTKPTGPICNLDCKYCFYLEKEKLYPKGTDWAMPPHVLESFIRQHIEAHSVPEVLFAWQGGEPTLLGVDYFRKAFCFAGSWT